MPDRRTGLTVLPGGAGTSAGGSPSPKGGRPDSWPHPLGTNLAEEVPGHAGLVAILEAVLSPSVDLPTAPSKAELASLAACLKAKRATWGANRSRLFAKCQDGAKRRDNLAASARLGNVRRTLPARLTAFGLTALISAGTASAITAAAASMQTSRPSSPANSHEARGSAQSRAGSPATGSGRMPSASPESSSSSLDGASATPGGRSLAHSTAGGTPRIAQPASSAPGLAASAAGTATSVTGQASGLAGVAGVAGLAGGLPGSSPVGQSVASTVQRGLASARHLTAGASRSLAATGLNAGVAVTAGGTARTTTTGPVDLPRSRARADTPQALHAPALPPAEGVLLPEAR